MTKHLAAADFANAKAGNARGEGMTQETTRLSCFVKAGDQAVGSCRFGICENLQHERRGAKMHHSDQEQGHMLYPSAFSLDQASLQQFGFVAS